MKPSHKDIIKLHELLKIAAYTSTLRSASTKADIEHSRVPKPTERALHDDFIYYGNRKATSFIIIDIDHIKAPLSVMETRVKEALGFRPTWILKTDKGFHVGIILDRPVFLDNSGDAATLQHIKREWTTLLNGDIAGSHRLTGFWRNPLTHESIIDPRSFSLYQLLTYLPEQTPQTAQKRERTTTTLKPQGGNKISEAIERGFVQGNRNNYLFSKGYHLLYTGQTSADDLEGELMAENDGQLSHREVSRIAKSLARYQPTMVKSPKCDRPVRGEFSDLLFLNEIHNFRSTTTRQHAGAMITAAKKTIKTSAKIIQCYKDLFTKGRTVQEVVNSEISTQAGISIRQLQRYKSRGISKLAQEVFEQLFMQVDTVIRANGTPLLQHLKIIDIHTRREYLFDVNAKGSLIFREDFTKYQETAQ